MAGQDQIDLFTPLEIGGLILPNRIVMAPLTRNRAAEGNVPQAMNQEYYCQRATAALIITEASQVSPQGVGYPMTPGIHSDAQIEGWKKITQAVHDKGGRILLQLWHVGRISHPSLQPNGDIPVAPSAIKPAGEAFTYEGLQAFVTPRALEINEIPSIVDQFKKAAEHAKLAGFDGVELHAANGYLIDQFLRDGSNHRQDAYGGSLENRVRLLLEISKAVTDVWNGNRVGVRISPAGGFNDMSDSDPQTTFNFIVEKLNAFKLAYIHVIESLESTQTFDFSQLRNRFEGIYMANFGYDYDRATKKLQAGEADLISFGQLFIANPDLPKRFQQRAELNSPDPDTFYGGDEKGYTDYAAMT